MIEKKSFEDYVKELNEILNKLERGDTDLEESVNLFQQGVNLYKECKKLIEESKVKVTEVMETLKDTEGEKDEMEHT